MKKISYDSPKYSNNWHAYPCIKCLITIIGVLGRFRSAVECRLNTEILQMIFTCFLIAKNICVLYVCKMHTKHFVHAIRILDTEPLLRWI